MLYQSYLVAEERGLVDNLALDQSNRNIGILPIYHTNRRSDGFSVLQIYLDDDGTPKRIAFIEDSAYTIFPITEDSLNRTSNVFAHPLCDDMQYLSKNLHERKHQNYLEQNKLWTDEIIPDLSSLHSEEADELIAFIEEIQEVVHKWDVLDLVKTLLKQNYIVVSEDQEKIELEIEPETDSRKARTKNVDLSKVFVSFGKEYVDTARKDIDVSSNRLLHNSHIRLIQNRQAKEEDQFDTCDISGRRMYCTNRNRGLIGMGKIVGGSHDETHKGRFYDSNQVIRLGGETSEKIHLMLKFFLEHRQNMQPLYNNTTAVFWFLEDILNERDFSLNDPTSEADIFDIILEEDELEESLENERAEAWKKVLRGERELSEDLQNDFFYLLMLNKISNGRIAIQGQRTMPTKEFMVNLKHWQETCSWDSWHRSSGSFKPRTPRPWDIVRFVYGIENDNGWVECLKDEQKSLAFRRLLPSVIDGAPLPRDMARQIFTNFKNRIAYEKNWTYLQYMSCALLNKMRQDEGRGKRHPMLEKDKQTRDYLYGRLLAVYEKIELDAMRPRGVSSDQKEGKGSSMRVTNVGKIWGAFFQNPERMLQSLHGKIKPYLNRLKNDKAGLFIYLNNLASEIQTEIRDSEEYLENKNRALNEDAVFGYYAQNRDFYTSRDAKEENENA